MKEDKTFKTKDFYLACFLKAKDIKLIRTEKAGSIVIFHFESKKIEDLINGFYNDQEMISANKFINSIRDLKALVHNI